MSVLLSTARTTAWHEATHASAMMLGKPPLIPKEVRVDFPTDTLLGKLAGVTRIDWGDDGITKASAQTVLRAVIAGGQCEGGDWMLFPLDPEVFPVQCRGDVEHCRTLCRYLEIDNAADWLWHVFNAEQLWKRQDFRRLVVTISTRLQYSEVLSKQDLIELLEDTRDGQVSEYAHP